MALKVNATQASTDSETVVADTALRADQRTAVSYTLENTGANAIDVTVYRANEDNFSDEVQDGAAINIASGAKATYVDAQSAFVNYRLKVASAAAGLPGTLVAVGVARD